MAGSRYEIIRQLACGGMAEVLLARQSSEALEATGTNGHNPAKPNEKLVVIKRVLPHLCQEEVFLKMFAFEARIASQLRHPHIVSVLEVGSMDGMPFIALERLDGADLFRLLQQCNLRRQSLGVAVALAVIAGAARGLGYAHRARSSDGRALKVVHRDVSPHNIFVTREGGVKILDFGIAKSAAYVGHTNTGQIKGKVAYMSPEQIRGHKIDSRADLWALGVVLWEAIAGEKLYARDNDAASLHSILNDPIPELHCPEAPGLNGLIRQVLDHNPEKRIATAEEFATRIDRMLAAMGVALASRVVALRVGSLVPALNPELDAVKPLVRRNPEVVTFAVGPAPQPQRRALELRPRDPNPPAPSLGNSQARAQRLLDDDDEPTVSEFDEDFDLDDHPTIITFSDDPADEIDDQTTQRSFPDMNEALEVAESPTVQSPSAEALMAPQEPLRSDEDFDFDDFMVATGVIAQVPIRSNRATISGAAVPPALLAPAPITPPITPTYAPTYTPPVTPPSAAPMSNPVQGSARPSGRPQAPVLPASVFNSNAPAAPAVAPMDSRAPAPQMQAPQMQAPQMLAAPISRVPPLHDVSLETIQLTDFEEVSLRPSVPANGLPPLASSASVARVKPRGSRMSDAPRATEAIGQVQNVKTIPQGSMATEDELKSLPFDSLFAPPPPIPEPVRQEPSGPKGHSVPPPHPTEEPARVSSPSSAFPNPFASHPPPGQRGPSAFATSELRTGTPNTLTAAEVSRGDRDPGHRGRRIIQSALLIIGATCFIAGLTIFTIRVLSLGDGSSAEAATQPSASDPRVAAATTLAPSTPTPVPVLAPPVPPPVIAPPAPTPVIAPPVPTPVIAPTTPVVALPVPVVAPTTPVVAPTAPPTPVVAPTAPSTPVIAPPAPMIAPPAPMIAPPAPMIAPPAPVIAPPAPVIAPRVAAPAASPRIVPTPVQPRIAPAIVPPGPRVTARPSAPRRPRNSTGAQNRHLPQGTGMFEPTPPPAPRRPPPSARNGGIFTDLP